jgi:acyl-CoA synthetase (AMP-forming)/AMP-acid ligase II
MYPGKYAETTPDKPAVIMAGTGATMTFAELDAAANRLSHLLRQAGLGVGDHVAFCLENHPRYHEIAWGCAYAGVNYTAMSSRLTTEEAEYILNDSGARVFITSSYKRDMAAALQGRMPAVELALMLDGTIDGFEPYEDGVAGQSAEPLPDPRIAGRDMLYSSGTTGRPKGVKLPPPDQPLDQPNALVLGCQILFGFDDTTVYLSPAPLYHAAPLRFTMAAHSLGGTVVVMEHFDPEEFLALVERYHVTNTQVVPTMLIRMLKLPDEQRLAYDVRSLRGAIHAAAPCPIPVKEAMIEWWGPIISEYYAGTEGNGLVFVDSENWLAHKGTVGKALTGEVHIVDDDGNEVPVGEEGTIYFGGGPAFEYHNDPKKTAESRLANGWSTLGDVGRLDDDGYLYLTDRKAYMIITGGVNVYPQEAENLLAMHPKVNDVAVIGVPNADFGEEVKAVVEPAADVEVGPELERELIAYCRQHLSDLKCPRTVDFVDELPRAPTGKLYKRLVRDKYWEGHESRLV